MSVDFHSFVWAVNWIVLTYFIVLNGFYLMLSLAANFYVKRYYRRISGMHFDDLISENEAPPITLVAPAYNEEATCVESVRSLLSLHFPDFEVIVVNDGSKDHTSQVLREAFELYEAPIAPTAKIPCQPVELVLRSRIHPNLVVLEKKNGGKADALNAGINYTATPLFCAMDSDSLLEPDSLSRMARAFLEDSKTLAVGGSIRVVNDCTIDSGWIKEVRMPRRLLPAIQVVEYLRAFLVGRIGWHALGSTLIISGAFGVFRRSAVVEVGGYAHDTVGEDMELVVRLHKAMRRQKRPYAIKFIPDPVAWTEAPDSLKVLGRQRDRWQRGLWDVLWRHKGMLLNPRYGSIGMVAYPYYFFLEMLGPVVEALGYITFAITLILGWGTGWYALAFLTVAVVLGIALSFLALGIEELSFRKYSRLSDLFKMFGLVLIENFGYRQLTTWWRIKGVYNAIRGKKGWGKMTRRGFASGSSS
ncbi:glycosyltransferase family 2 protein [bacterium]|nr:glycosyltransferase family 2 protein [bacterium]